MTESYVYVVHSLKKVTGFFFSFDLTSAAYELASQSPVVEELTQGNKDYGHNLKASIDLPMQGPLPKTTQRGNWRKKN